MDGRAYSWISSLPPLSQWDVSERSFVFLEGSVDINVRREDGVTIYLNFSEIYTQIPKYSGRVGHFTEEHPKVISSLLFKNFHAFISLMLSRFQKDGFDSVHNDLPSLEELILSDVDSGITRKPCYPLHFKFWKIGIQCRALDDEINYVGAAVGETLSSQLSSQQLNCTIQLEHHVDIKNKFIEAQVHVDNLIYDVLPFKILPKICKEKFIWTELFFPSKIVISVVPQCQSNDLILSLGQSTDNPAVQTSTGQSLELAFQTPKEVGIKKSFTTSSIQTLNYWKFLQTAEGVDGSFKWILYDPLSGVEVLSSKPRKKSIFKSDSNTWYKDRYKKACSPFSEKGGVVFAADKYGRTLTWTMNRNMEGKMLKFKVEGSIWLTYWPNLSDTYFYMTVRHDFSEEFELQLTES